MADRTRVRNSIKGLFDANPNISNAAFEANLVVSTRELRSQLVNLNVNATNVILSEISQNTWSDNVEIVSFEILPGVAINTTDGGTVVNIWKMNTIGAAKTVIATINTAAMAANVNAFESITANIATHLANTEILRGGCIGYDNTIATTGVSAGVVNQLVITLRGK